MLYSISVFTQTCCKLFSLSSTPDGLPPSVTHSWYWLIWRRSLFDKRFFKGRPTQTLLWISAFEVDQIKCLIPSSLHSCNQSSEKWVQLRLEDWRQTEKKKITGGCSRITEWRRRSQINILNAKIGPPGVWQIFHTAQPVEMKMYHNLIVLLPIFSILISPDTLY